MQQLCVGSHEYEFGVISLQRSRPDDPIAVLESDDVPCILG
jgi:hypothetical protein